jgi:hypothetical protein
MRLAAIALSFLLVFSAGNAAAGPLNIANIVGGWVAGSVTGGTADVNNVANQGTDVIRWPAGAGSQSGLDMTPAADILGVPLGSAFLLGTFVHVNQPTGGTINCSLVRVRHERSARELERHVPLRGQRHAEHQPVRVPERQLLRRLHYGEFVESEQPDHGGY